MRLYHFAVFILLLLFVNSCQKEETKFDNSDDSVAKNEQEALLQLDWRGKEAEFFNVNRMPLIYEDLAVENRSDEGYNYLVKVFNIIANQNDEYHFANGLAEEFGYPYWLLSHFYKEGNQKAIYIPIAKEEGTNVEALLFVIANEDNSFHFKFIPRSEINQVIFEDATEFDNLPFYLFLFYNFDKILFGVKDQDLLKYWFENAEDWESRGILEERCFIEIVECFPCGNGDGGTGGGYNPPNPLIAGGGGGTGIGDCFFCFPSLDDIFVPLVGNNDQESSMILEDRNVCCISYLYPCGGNSNVPPSFINPLGGVWWNGNWIDTGSSGGGTIFNGGNSEASAALACASNYMQVINNYGLNMSVPDLQGLTGNNCECGSLGELEDCINSDEEICAKIGLMLNENLQNLNDILGFSEEEICFLWKDGESMNSQGIISQILDFYDPSDVDTEKNDYVKSVVTLIMEDEEYKFERFEELYELLENDNNALIKDCFPSGDISNWNDLLAFQIPQNCIDRLDDEGLGNQPITFGNGNTVNLDYYSITFGSIPNNPNGGSFNSIGDFFDYFRKNFNSFLDPTISSFDYYEGPNINDESLWLSNDPLRTLFSININVLPQFPELPSDDGMVICSSAPGCCWVFSTVKTPQGFFLDTNANDGTHPVSGNRQFGYIENANGSFTIYTKGADRVRFPALLSWFLPEAAAYDGGAALWEDLIDQLNGFLSQNSGNVISTDKNGTGQIPKWDLISQQLKSLSPITIIPCE